jgi:cell pole-organizing protein PopZ
MADPAHNEPSMDEILSSIRKIVSQDDRRSSEDRRRRDPQDGMTDSDRPVARTSAATPSVSAPSGHVERPVRSRDEVNLASLANLVRGQLPRSGEPAPESARYPDAGRSVERNENRPAMESQRFTPALSDSLADLQRSVTKSFLSDSKGSAQSSGFASGQKAAISSRSSNPPPVPVAGVPFAKVGESGRHVAASASPPHAHDYAKADNRLMNEKPTEPRTSSISSHSSEQTAPASPRYGPMASGYAAGHVAGMPVDKSVSAEDRAGQPDAVSATELERAAAKSVEAPAEGSGSDTEAGAFREALVAPSTQSAVGSSLDRLKKSAMGDIDARVEAILRPMLREWLDDNLPRLVESAVREEIERIARES